MPRGSPPPKRTSESYGLEIADLLARYDDRKTSWRDQDEIWQEIRKRLVQYRAAKQREEKANRRVLWQAEKERRDEAIRIARGKHQKGKEST